MVVSHMHGKSKSENFVFATISFSGIGSCEIPLLTSLRAASPEIWASHIPLFVHVVEYMHAYNTNN